MDQPTVTEIIKEGGITYAKAGAEEQKVLGRSGDMITIDWGYLYIPAINGHVSVSPANIAVKYFAATGLQAPDLQRPV
ncbi:MAG: hypothetical protein K2G40_05720, partial [Muribaculaceae bacterium]|nr:hypothetical protein [Muribaculaceae bacterium]